MLNFFRRKKKVDDTIPVVNPNDNNNNVIPIVNNEENVNLNSPQLGQPNNLNNQNINQNNDVNSNPNNIQNNIPFGVPDPNLPNNKPDEHPLSIFANKKPVASKIKQEKKQYVENKVQKEFKNIFQGSDFFSNNKYRIIVMNIAMISIIADMIILEILW